MIREWATVVAWKQGVATLRCEQKTSCVGCQAHASCGMRILSEVKPDNVLEFQLPIEQPLVVGQRVELGIPEVNLLRSAALVYLVPLCFSLLGAIISSWFIAGNLFAIIGALVGGGSGLLVAKRYALYLETKNICQPIVLRIALPSGTY